MRSRIDRKKAVGPAAKRLLVGFLRKQHQLSERRAGKAISVSRSVARYEPRPDQDDEVIEMLSKLAERFPERGFSKLFKIIR